MADADKKIRKKSELLKQLDDIQVKNAAESYLVLNRLLEQGRQNAKELNLFKKKYREAVDLSAGELNSFAEKAKTEQERLHKAVKSFNESFNIENIKDALLDKKAKEPARLEAQKELSKQTLKIKALEKELLGLKASQDVAIREYTCNYKQKLSEHDKHRRFELNKIENNTIKEYADLQKKIIGMQKYVEGKKTNKAIKDIRRRGINYEQDCLSKHLEKEYNYHTEYEKQVYQKQLATLALIKEKKGSIIAFKTVLAELANKLKRIEHNDEISVLKESSEIRKEKRLLHNTEKVSVTEDIKTALLNLYHTEKKVEAERQVLLNKGFLKAKEMDSMHYENLIELINLDNDFLNQDLTLIKADAEARIDNGFAYLAEILQTKIKSQLAQHQKAANNLLIMKEKTLIAPDYRMDEASSKIKELNLKLQANENLNEEHLNNDFKTIALKITKEMNEIQADFASLNKKIGKYFIDFNQEIIALINETYLHNVNILAEKVKHAASQSDIKIKATLDEYQTNIDSLKRERKQIEDDYAEDQEKIQDAVKAYKSAFTISGKSAAKAKATMLENNENEYHQALNSLNTNYNERMKELQAGLLKEREKINKEYKRKVGLL